LAALSPGAEQPRREADHSPPINARLRNAWSYTSSSIRPHEVDFRFDLHFYLKAAVLHVSAVVIIHTSFSSIYTLRDKGRFITKFFEHVTIIGKIVHKEIKGRLH
jgi:hypothetical protein